MPSVVVVPADKKGQYRVLVNYIQSGITYSSRELADSKAVEIRRELEERYRNK